MKNLQKKLKKALEGAESILVLGVGSELRADDVAGILVARELLRFKPSQKTGIKFSSILGETAPENFTGYIKKFKPSHLIIVDSADMGKKAGSVFLFDSKKELYGVSFCTHNLPIQVMTDYLLNFFSCKIILIGIQPKTLTFGKECSMSVKDAALKTALLIRDVIKG